MEHWFDQLTKQLASDGLSRRRLLKWALAGAGAAVIGWGRAPRTVSLAQPPQPGQCTVRREGQFIVVELSAEAEVAGKHVTLRQTTRKAPAKGPLTVRKIITFGGKALLEIEESSREGVTRLDINYGPDFHGVKHGVFRSTDGKVIRGEIDGRQLKPFRVGDDPKSAKFAEGVTPPGATVSPDVEEAIRTVFEKAKDVVAAGCKLQNVGSTGERRFTEVDHRSLPRSYWLASASALPAVSSDLGRDRVWYLAQGDSGHGSTPATSGACVACETGCVTAGIGCALGVAGGCAGTLFFYGVCVAIGEASCAIAEATCVGLCHVTGAPCCPVGCGDVACCEGQETCLDLKIGLCCSKGLSACSGKHCCKPTDTCINATGFCCPQGQLICNNVCCKTGEVCNQGIVCCPPAQQVCGGVCCQQGEVCVNNNKKCCPEGLACGKVCCDQLSRCADPNKSLCCSFTSEACGSVCCKPGETCLNGKCCSKPCGSVCCASGQVCKDGKCISMVCPSKQVTCLSEDGPDKQGAAICCPPNVACCLGKCCKPGELCCSGPGIPFGCHLPGLCVA
jgi:hypothetical protein